MPRRWSARLSASLAAACVAALAGCSSAAGGTSAGGGTSAAGGDPSPTAAASRAARTNGAPEAAQPAIASVPAGTARSASPARAGGTQYYLALGDSLAEGYQPDQETGQGYPNQLAARLRAHGRVLSLDNLSCGGETTETMNQGGICSYPGGPSQLQAALAFLRAHPGRVPLITIDIGGNDVDPCTGLGSTSSADSCIRAALPAVNANLAAALKALRGADPSAVLTGLNYYVPELANWLDGGGGQRAAAAQVSATRVLNAALAADYRAAGARTADVFAAFQSTSLASQTPVPGYGRLPVAVARVCEWTWMCRQEDEHANTTGYRVIAGAVYAALPASITR